MLHKELINSLIVFLEGKYSHNFNFRIENDFEFQFETNITCNRCKCKFLFDISSVGNLLKNSIFIFKTYKNIFYNFAIWLDNDDYDSRISYEGISCDEWPTDQGIERKQRPGFSVFERQGYRTS